MTVAQSRCLTLTGHDDSDQEATASRKEKTKKKTNKKSGDGEAMYLAGSIMAVRAGSNRAPQIWFAQLQKDLRDNATPVRVNWLEDCGEEPEEIYTVVESTDNICLTSVVADVTHVLQQHECTAAEQSLLLEQLTKSSPGRPAKSPIVFYRVPDGVMNDLKMSLPLTEAQRERMAECQHETSQVRSVSLLRRNGPRADGRPSRATAGRLLKRTLVDDATSDEMDEENEERHNTYSRLRKRLASNPADSD